MPLWTSLGSSLILLAQDAAQKPLIMRLDGATRAKVLAALAGLVILGFLMVVLTWLGGRVVRRYMGVGIKPKPLALPGDEEWTRPVGDANAATRKERG
jgi:hypothetical protein